VLDRTEREAIIFERQQIMMQLSRDSELLGKIVAGSESRGKLPQATRGIAQGAHDAAEAYRLALPGGHTRPEAWSNRADFMARMQAFSRNADAMAAAGERNDVNAVIGLMIDALPCKQCHDVYREKKPF
jgi:cytochrome c556